MILNNDERLLIGKNKIYNNFERLVKIGIFARLPEVKLLLLQYNSQSVQVVLLGGVCVNWRVHI